MVVRAHTCTENTQQEARGHEPIDLAQFHGIYLLAIVGGAKGHPWAGSWVTRMPVGLLACPREYQAVTAAVCMCRSDLWRSLNGLREDLPVNYGDVDFCLRARELGFNVMFDPASRWTHFESASRTLAKVPAELPRFRELWYEKLGGLRCIDPFFPRWRELRRGSS